MRIKSNPIKKMLCKHNKTTLIRTDLVKQKDGSWITKQTWLCKKCGKIINLKKLFTKQQYCDIIIISKQNKKSEKDAAIAEIHKCKELQESKKEIATMFANHFHKYKDAYLK